MIQVVYHFKGYFFQDQGTFTRLLTLFSSGTSTSTNSAYSNLEHQPQERESAKVTVA